MKKLFTFFAVATFVVALSSCGGAKTEEATATEEVTATEEMPAEMPATESTDTASTETAASTTGM
jgi:hypothetical protein